jgi:ABC-type lipoprotein export system ATPase subunit
MADEPTGNLDTTSGDEIMELLLRLNQERGTTLIIVTHDPEIADKTQRIVQILDGCIADQDDSDSEEKNNVTNQPEGIAPLPGKAE